MTTWNEVEADSKFVKILDHGFVGLVDHMGSDDAVVQAARVSYGNGTKTVREDRGLIRYLMRHDHTSPFEMLEVKLHIKLPIFVMRQLVRHRTASLNEYSGRYSEMTDEFYVPEIENIKPQSVVNKQGRGGSVSPTDAPIVQKLVRAASSNAYALYESLLGSSKIVYEDEVNLSSKFPGIARESARTILPLNNYTEVYWKQNVKNLMHMLKLRMDPHAQWEIQELARAIYQLVQPLFPLTFEAFEDYQNQALTLSRMEKELMADLINPKNLITGESVYSSILTPALYLEKRINKIGKKDFATSWGLSERELQEFIDKWNLYV